jgi:hypothetical protein
MGEFTVVNGEVGYLDVEDENSAVYRLDKPIIAYMLTRRMKKFFFHQTQDDVKEMLVKDDKKY